MSNPTQVDRYKKLLDYIDKKFKEDITIETVEEVCHYSYRNINRIFLALHHETIGKYIKRIRLEKAAQYLKYADSSISDIALRVGFGDVAAFSKAFKNKFHCSPSAFRDSSLATRELTRQTLGAFPDRSPEEVPFEIEILPDFDMLYLAHRGAYEDIPAIKKAWEQFSDYLRQGQLLTGDTIFLAEILDDNEISEDINCRYHTAIVLEKPLLDTPEGLFRTKRVKRQKYAKFLHRGTHESCLATYDKIYAHWMSGIPLELVDLPTLEFFLDDENNISPNDLRTEIYIPVK